MTDAIDKVAAKWTKPISKMTGGLVLGKNDPISKLLEVDQASIAERMALVKAAKNPPPAAQLPAAELRMVETMEQRRAILSDSTESDDSIGSAIKLIPKEE